MDRKRMNSILKLPHELEMDILAKLPAKTLFRCKAVCKNWRDTIKSREFGKMQLSYNKKNRVEKVVLIDEYDVDEQFAYYYVDGKLVHPPPVLGSYIDAYPCDGIMFVVVESPNQMVLWNPTTRKTREIPFPPSSFRGACFYGCHYDSASGKFKILIVRPKCVQIFDSDSSSDSDPWKIVDIPSNIRDMLTEFRHRMSMAFIHGNFHFLGNKGVVLRLNLEGEITTLSGRLPPEIEKYRIKVWDGRLCMDGGKYIPSYKNYQYEVWTMEEYGNAESWNQVFSLPMKVPVSSSQSPFSPLQNGCRMVVCQDPAKSDGVLPLYLLGNGRRILVRNNEKGLCVHDLDTDALTQIPPLPELPKPSQFRLVSNYVLTCTESLLDP